MKKYFLLVITMLSIVACGDLVGKKEAKRVVDLSGAAGCALNIDNLNKIFEKIIAQDLNCLSAKLDEFISSVETDRPGYISKEVLQKIESLEGTKVVMYFGKSEEPASIQLRILKEVKNNMDYQEKLKDIIELLDEFHFKVSLSIEAEFYKKDEIIVHSIQTKNHPILSRNQAFEVIENQN